MTSSDRATSPKDQIIAKLLSRDDLTFEQLIELAKVQSTTNDAAAGAQSPRTTWLSIFPWAALFTMIGGIATAYITGAFDLSTKQSGHVHTIRLEELKHQQRSLSELLIIDPTEFETPEERKTEREARICFAITFGVVEVSETFLGVSKANRNDYVTALGSVLKRYKCSQAKLPEALPSLASAPNSRVGCAGAKYPVQLTLPQSLTDSTTSGAILLRTAVEESNRGVHEICQYQRVGLYWRSLGDEYSHLDGRDREVPWSAAFTSFLVSKLDEPRRLAPAATHYKLWQEAVRKGYAYKVGEKVPEPGDLVFYYREQEPNDVNTENWPGDSGVVYLVVGDLFVVIHGNQGHMVQPIRRSLSDEKLVGFVRFP